MPSALQQTIFIVGPTGCGKSSVAMELAGKIGSKAVIVNADAFQIYRGLEILSAAPTKADLKRADHQLYGILDPADSFDVASYEKLATTTLDSLIRDGRVPIVVGGSGLYVKSLTHGLGPTPPGDPILRAELNQLSLDELVARLEAVDPVGALNTNLKNRRYVTRNLEISILSGVPASTLKRDFESKEPKFNGFLLAREREELYSRINLRTHEMFSDGVIEEVKRIHPVSDTAEKAIGFREIRRLISNEISQEECIELIQMATRRYSKRQRTWFKREKGFTTIELEPSSTADAIASQILGMMQEAN